MERSYGVPKFRLNTVFYIIAAYANVAERLRSKCASTKPRDTSSVSFE